jgi:thioredoxin-like negative regulator of GroEL
MSTTLIFLLFVLIGPAPQKPGSSKSQPSSAVPPLIQQGVQAYKAGDRSSAIQFLCQAYRLSPAHPDVQLLLGLMLYEEKPDSQEAQRLLEASSPRFPANKDLNLKLLDSYLQTGAVNQVPLLLDRLRPLMIREPEWGFQILYTLIRYGRVEWARHELPGVTKEIERSWAALSLESLGASQKAR